MNLPIDVVSGTDPPIFRWKQVVDTIDGKRVVEHESSLPCTVEMAVSRLVTIAKQLLMDNAALQGQVMGMADRIAAQSELLGKRAEKADALDKMPAGYMAPGVLPHRKGK